MPEFDLIVVGAGSSGLIAANTWLEIHPDDEVLILESSFELGGVWSRSRVLPKQMTQTPIGMLEFSSYPMQQLPQNETFHKLFPAQHVTSYLEEFSTHKMFADRTIKDRILFESSVKHIEKVFNLWNIETAHGQSFFTKKLIIATGQTPLPNLLNLPTESFIPPIIHSRDLAAKVPTLSSPDIKSIVIIGGGKSAFDAISLLRSFPTPPAIHWLIRTTGHGTANVATPDAPWPFSTSSDLLSTRLISKLSPCIFEPLDFWAKVWHGNKVGIWLADQIWKAVDTKWRRAARYDRNDNMRNLKPDRPAFWSSDRTVFHTREMWDTISNVTILRDDIESLYGSEVTLRSGKIIKCNAIIATADLLNYPMFPDKQATDLGLPLPVAKADMEDTAEWEVRIGRATERVIAAFPRLANMPSYPAYLPKSTPSRLYRYMIPTHDNDEHSIAFLGMVGTTQPFNVAEVQALWATAYLMDEINLPREEEMKDEVALATAWRRRRYLGDGDTFGFEQLQYTSMLLRDLGLNDLRKGSGWRELLKPYQSADYRGILEEWKIGMKEMGEIT